MKAQTKWIIELILGAILIIILVPTVIKVAGKVWNQIALKLGWVKLTPVEKAILCSYYRCTEGCASPDVSGELGGKGWCADFPGACSLPSEAYEGEELKVCGEAAEQWPVKVKLKKGETISEFKLQSLMGIDCLIEMNSGVNNWDQFRNGIWRSFTGKAATNNVWVSEDLIGSGQKKECSLGFENSYSEIKLKGDKAYVVTYLDKREFGPLKVVHRITNLYSNPIYPESPVILFEDENYGGDMVTTSHSLSDLGGWGMLGNKISSVIIHDPKIKYIVLYNCTDYCRQARGTNITLAGSSPELWMRGASSIKLIGDCSSGVEVYSKENYRGETKTITYNTKYLSNEKGGCMQWCDATGCEFDWDDCIKSIKIPDGCKVILYEDPGYKGNYMVLTGNNPTLNFNDKAMSVKVVFQEEGQ